MTTSRKKPNSREIKVARAITLADWAMERLVWCAYLPVDINNELCYFIQKGDEMPRRKTSVKKTRQDKKKHLQNLKIKQQLKKTIKQFQGLLALKNIAEAKKLLSQVFSQLDKAAKKRTIHPQTANRRKSRLMKRLGKAA